MMHMHLRSLLSTDPREREDGLHRLLAEFKATHTQPEGSSAGADGESSTCKGELDKAQAGSTSGISAVLCAILKHEPVAAIRCAALSHPLCSLETISAALSDTSKDVRTNVLALLMKTEATDTAQHAVPALFIQLAMESDENTRLSIMNTLRHLYLHFQPANDTTLYALGLRKSTLFKNHTAYQPLQYAAIIQHIVRHDLVPGRHTICGLLYAILSQVLVGIIVLQGESKEIAGCCFALVETLIQDSHIQVRWAAIDVLLEMMKVDVKGCLRSIALFSRKSVKCLLQLMESSYHDRNHSFTNGEKVLRLFAFYSCADLGGYSILEESLRKKWFEARKAAVQDKEGQIIRATLSEEMMMNIVKINLDSARVLDLGKRISNKFADLRGINDM